MNKEQIKTRLENWLDDDNSEIKADLFLLASNFRNLEESELNQLEGLLFLEEIRVKLNNWADRDNSYKKIFVGVPCEIIKLGNDIDKLSRSDLIRLESLLDEEANND